jgi:serine/threonine-protein kinase
LAEASRQIVEPEPDLLWLQLAAVTEGEYRILAELGRGAMAAVYLAEDLALGRLVAIKMMIPGPRSVAGMTERLLLEARAAARLSHSHIIPIYAVRTSAGLGYFVMKFLPGRSLDELLTAEGPLPSAVVQEILAQVGSALEHAHWRGVVHRDVKPANIMLDEEGSAIVTDFGIALIASGASLKATGSAVGTPAYMSPEQCTGKAVTGASDQYSLGCVAFELLTGRPPFVHEDVMPVMMAHVSHTPPKVLSLRPDCPPQLAAAVDRMLAKDPAARWPSLAAASRAADAGPGQADPGVRVLMRQMAAPRELPPFTVPRPPVSGSLFRPCAPLPMAVADSADTEALELDPYLSGRARREA